MSKMNSRERLLTAINNQCPDRLPCQVHSWMEYYLNNYLDGMDQWQAYEKFDMDFVVYTAPEYRFDETDLADWQVERKQIGTDSTGNKLWEEKVTTPEGELHRKGATSPYTEYDTKHLIKNEKDMELFLKYWPIPIEVDISGLKQQKERLGDRGILRGLGGYYWGQISPWQSLCFLAGTQESIMWTFDKPDFVKWALDEMLKKSLKVIELCKNWPIDIVEVGGGAASNTVISPDMFEEYCLPYDRKQNRAIHEFMNSKVVYHLCGGMMKMADLVIQTGADGLETMTPVSMGGDCDLKKASENWGDRLFFIGGFDQNKGFENGSPEDAREIVKECFEATRDHAGYIISPSDHFFKGDIENLHAFVKAAKECKY